MNKTAARIQIILEKPNESGKVTLGMDISGDTRTLMGLFTLAFAQDEKFLGMVRDAVHQWDSNASLQKDAEELMKKAKTKTEKMLSH